MKLINQIIISLLGLLLLLSAAHAQEFVVKGHQAFEPDCKLLLHNQVLDRMWYVPKPLEVDTIVRPDKTTIIKLHLTFAMGACEEIPHHPYAPVKFKFVPGDAWLADENGIIKGKHPYVIKTYATTTISPQNLLQNRLSLILSRDELKAALASGKSIKLPVRYTLSGLHDGMYYKKYPFFKFSYVFQLKEDGKIWISIK